jgi:hypothetical protein
MDDESELLRDTLTDNAFGHLYRAATDLERAPRDASIHLSAALELLLKARLAHAHWSLVDKRPGTTPFAKVQNGEFSSVGFSEAIERVATITGMAWQVAERRILESIANHRNKLLHFHNPDFDNSALREQLALDQCRAWSIFRRLLEGPWNEAFPDIEQDLEKAHEFLVRNTAYLQVRFEHAGAAIGHALKSGLTVRTCTACGFESLVVKEAEFQVVSEECNVCGLIAKRLRVKCTSCGAVFEGIANTRLICSCGAELGDEERDAQLALAPEKAANCARCRSIDSARYGTEDLSSRCICLTCLDSYSSRSVECFTCGKRWVGHQDRSGFLFCPSCAESRSRDESA